MCVQVMRGTIYALLGPSGCGKTTLLSCILGRKSLESGHIAVFGGCPGDRSLGLPGGLVGFMPQDICLFSEFTFITHQGDLLELLQPGLGGSKDVLTYGRY